MLNRLINYLEFKYNCIDFRQIKNVQVDGIDMRDAYDFVDAFISYAELRGIPLTEYQLDKLNEHSDYVYDQVLRWIY